MRKLKLQVQMSVDGFVAGQGGQLDWMTWKWDEALKNYVQELTDSVDSILLGRKLAEGFIPHWAEVASNPKNPFHDSGKQFVGLYKIVFTQTLEKSEWDNTDLAKGNLTDEVKRLKQQDGKDMIVYGGSTFVASLIKEKLIDEFHLFVNPMALGSGLPIFQHLKSYQKLKLVNSIAFDCGIVLLHYEPLS